MDRFNQTKKRRLRGIAQPVPFKGMSIVMQERVKEREMELRSAGLWQFLSELAIPWPSQCELGELIENYMLQDHNRVPVSGHIVELSSETLSRVTLLPGEGEKDMASLDLPKEAPQWKMVFSGGLLSFDTIKQGWDLRDLKEPWKEWFLLIQERIELSDGGFMEHCVACAALLAWVKGERFNWAEELRLRIRDEVHRKKTPFPFSLLSAGYLGMVCSLTIVPSEVEMLAGNPRELLLEPPVLLMPIPSSPRAPTIVEVPVLHVEAESSRRVLPREEMPEEGEQLSSHEELLSEIERQKTIVEERSTLLADSVRMREELKKENQKLKELKDKLESQCKKHEEMNVERLEQIIFEREILEKKSKEAEKLAKQLSELTTQHASREAAWEKEKKELKEREVRREKTIVQKSQELQSLQSQLSTLKREGETIRVISKQRDNLVAVKEQQRQTIGNLWGRIERLKNGLWTLENTSPPFPQLHHNYERQRDTMFIAHNLYIGQKLGPELFQSLWDEVSEEGYENLLVETIVRGELLVADPLKTLTIVGDIGARIFLYYGNLELQLQKRRNTIVEHTAQLVPRVPKMEAFNQAIATALPIVPKSVLEMWKANLEQRLGSMGTDEYVKAVMDASLERQVSTKVEDLGPGHYLLKYEQTIDRLKRYVEQFKMQVQPPLNLVAQSHFFAPSPNQAFRLLCSTKKPDLQLVDQKFLGNYEAMFDHPREQPVPTWEAINWLFRDVGPSRVISADKGESHDRVYARISKGWSPLPPLAVTMDPRFCPCRRRYKWSPSATIDSLEYNWPIVTGSFRTPAECANSYWRFFLEHKAHKDPVCFMAAVFCAMLAAWCKEYSLTWDINKFSATRPEALLATKHLYRTTRWMRCVEAMCATYFVIGPHHTMVNDFGHTRAKMMARTLQDQSDNNIQLPQEETMVPGFEEDYGPHISKGNWGASSSKPRKY